MPKKYFALFAVAVVGVVAGFGAAPMAFTNNDRPSNSQILFAQDVSGLMLNELLAALLQEFKETTPQNVEPGKQAISLVFNDHNKDIRLIGAFRPLLGKNNNRPDDAFEATALGLALTGQPYTAVEEINDTWYYRRSFPLSNTFHANCVLCHSNFTSDFFSSTNNAGQWVGSLIMRVPIKSNNDE